MSVKIVEVMYFLLHKSSTKLVFIVDNVYKLYKQPVINVTVFVHKRYPIIIEFLLKLVT